MQSLKSQRRHNFLFRMAMIPMFTSNKIMTTFRITFPVSTKVSIQNQTVIANIWNSLTQDYHLKHIKKR